MTGSVAVFPSQQFLDTDGQPVANGTLTVYQANTLTLAQTWTDKDQTTLNTNPIILDALGEPPDSIWLLPGSFYDVVLKDQLGATVRTYNDVTGANSVPQTSSGEWAQYGGTLTYIDPNTFTTPGNQTASFQRGRKILCYISPGLTVQGTIISGVFSTVTTVTVRFPNAATVLNAGLNRVDLSLITPLLSPIWWGDNLSVDLTGYSGADVQTQAGAIYTYTVTAATTLVLRIACGTGQRFAIDWIGDQVFAAGGASTRIAPNNGAIGAATLVNIQASSTPSNPATGVTAGQTFLTLDAGTTPQEFSSIISTTTKNKHARTTYVCADATIFYIGTATSTWIDTVTTWSSLGTITFGSAVTGVLRVTRLS